MAPWMIDKMKRDRERHKSEERQPLYVPPPPPPRSEPPPASPEPVTLPRGSMTF